MPQDRRDDSIETLRELCDQAQRLSRIAKDLCDRLTEQIEATQALTKTPKLPSPRRKVRTLQ
jgi:hypothetical protein